MPADAIEGLPDRAFPLRLEKYRVFLQEGVRELALLRKLKNEQRMHRGEQTGDPSYSSDDAGGSGGSAASSQDSNEAE